MWMYGHPPKQREHLAFGGVRTPDLWHIGHLLGRQNPPRGAILLVVGGLVVYPTDDTSKTNVKQKESDVNEEKNYFKDVKRASAM